MAHCRATATSSGVACASATGTTIAQVYICACTHDACHKPLQQNASSLVGLHQTAPSSPSTNAAAQVRAAITVEVVAPTTRRTTPGHLPESEGQAPPSTPQRTQAIRRNRSSSGCRISIAPFGGTRRQTGRRLDTHALDLRLRHAIAVAEVVVRVVERRSRLEIERRQRFDPGKLCGILLVFADAALSFSNITREEDHDRMEVGAGKTAHPVIGMVRSGIAKDRGAAAIP